MTVRELISALLEAVEDGAMALDSKVHVSTPSALDCAEADVAGIAYCIPPDQQGRRGWCTLELETD